MSLEIKDKHYAAVHVGNPAKSFSASESNEAERRGWDEETYRLKNHDMNNHYDITRKHLNFEINGDGEIVPLGSNPIPLHERLLQRLEQLGFKQYKDKNNPSVVANNSPNCTIGIIISGDHDVLTRLAFGDQKVDFTLKTSNADVRLRQGIKDWAKDTYTWACERWGEENIIGFDVHCDETTPHIHIQTIPVAMTKARGRASTTAERGKKECVSFAGVWGKNKYEFNTSKEQIHTDYHDKVGYKYGLERGEHISMLSPEERRNRVHKNKAVLEAERQAKDAVAKSRAEKKAVEEQKARIEYDIVEAEQRKAKTEKDLAKWESYAKAMNITEEELEVPELDTNPIVIKARMAMLAELEKPIPPFGRKEWQEDCKKAAKQIFTDMQIALIEAKAAQKKEVKQYGKSLYQKTTKEIANIIEQNKQLQKANKKLEAENSMLKKRISTMDETAISNLRKEKDTEIGKLQKECELANNRADKSDDIAIKMTHRLTKTEGQIKEMMAVPEIAGIWNSIQKNKKAFVQQLEQWIADAVAAILDFAKGHKSLFSDKDERMISQGILAKAIQNNLNPSNDEQRMQATHNLLDDMSWKGTTDYMYDFTKKRTEQVCEEMNVPQNLVKGLLIAAGGRAGFCACSGGGSDNALTNWDGTKRRGMGV